jgi:hypothetical protein
MSHMFIALLLLKPLTIQAQEATSGSNNGPLFMKDLVDEGDFFAPWGVGLDFFTMDQDYDIENLYLNVPALGGEIEIDPSQVAVTNKVQHFDLKLDAWITPFLNMYGLVGRVDADTIVDLGSVIVPGLGSLPAFPVNYDGTVWGLGANLVYGTDRWFGSVNTAWTKANLSGDYDSSVKTLTIQPRLGLIRNQWTMWVGGMWLNTEEKHSGTFELELPGIPPIPLEFDVDLETSDKWNYAAGIGYIFSPKATISFEYGFGDRTHTLFNFTYRF